MPIRWLMTEVLKGQMGFGRASFIGDWKRARPNSRLHQG